MQDPSDDMLMALADDELGPEEAAALRARIAADPALAARYAVFADTRAALQAAFAPEGPAPESLIRALGRPAVAASNPTATVVPLRRRIPLGAAPMALAASLVLAVGLGGFLAGRGMAPGGAAQDPAGQAAAGLAVALTGDTVALDGGGAARVLGSYATGQGLCRVIDLDLPDDRAERAVVCRAGADGWSVVATVAAGGGEAYIPASDTAAQVIDQVLDDLGAGPPLDPAAEAAALAQ